MLPNSIVHSLLPAQRAHIICPAGASIIMEYGSTPYIGIVSCPVGKFFENPSGNIR